MQVEHNGHLIVADGTYGYKEIKAVGKGSVHMSLRGKYTSFEMAKKAIDTYVNKKGDKGGKID